ncbi:protein HEADING DATE 3B isoform X2 [Phoenix dactylifera]|uniref:Protein HEADING DATE 3B isoform X2 n=1 Tax=Phoenix dactylifera TaxID=42345 RepID=A0A8B9ADE1_PHODC|nr:protein HEADING DATE 3B isoform X2 [Phoenix dactylifera]
MKGGKEKDRIMGPLFPRLHVNDTDKGGPRAPPRNKMALYEQLSIPSQRFNSAASSMPLPPPNASTLVPSASSSQGCGHERNVYSPFYMPAHTPAHSSERVNSCSFDGMNLNATRMEFARRSIKHTSNRSLNAAGSVAERSSLRQHDSNGKNSCEKKLDDEDDFRVPTFVQSGIGACSDRDAPLMGPEKLALISKSPQKNTSTTFISSLQCPNANDKPSEQTNTSDKSIDFDRNNGGKKPKETLVIEDLKERSVPHQVLEKSRHGSTGFSRDSCGNGVLGGPKNMNDINLVESRDASRARNKSMSKPSLENSHGTSSTADKCNGECGDKENGRLEMKDGEKKDEVSEASMVDSISGWEISPDDIVGVIGPKHFWKARRAIVNQQRVFALQVFELHRLIKVQKLIAASPHLLLEGNPYLNKFSAKVPSKSLPPEGNTESLLQTVKHKDSFQKPNQNAECPSENAAGAPTFPSCEDEVNQGLHDQVPRNEPYSGTPSPMSMAPENNPSAWCFHLPANQWLVPVMSPSEGLVYKPYTGPCPPTGGFMGPVYGSCTPLSLPPAAGDFMNPAYGVPASHQPQNMGVPSGAPPVAPNYFPAPYGLPVVNPVISSSAVEQVNPWPGLGPHGQIDQHSRGSCNMSHPKSEAFSCFWKFQASKDSELQGSTASSPCMKAQEESDALPLFPMAPATDGPNRPSQSSGRENQTRVIKVVPHNARSATESAARIFRSIQKERIT